MRKNNLNKWQILIFKRVEKHRLACHGSWHGPNGAYRFNQEFCFIIGTSEKNSKYEFLPVYSTSKFANVFNEFSLLGIGIKMKVDICDTKF